MPSFKVTVKEKVPEFEIVGFIVYVDPVNVTNEGSVYERVTESESTSMIAGSV